MLALVFQVKLLDIHAAACGKTRPRTDFLLSAANSIVKAQAAGLSASRDTRAALFAAHRRNHRQLDQPFGHIRIIWCIYASTMSFFVLCTNATTSSRSAWGTWNASRVA